jgi:hypothetical protein
MRKACHKIDLNNRVILIYKSTQNRIKSGFKELPLKINTLSGIWFLYGKIAISFNRTKTLWMNISDAG